MSAVVEQTRPGAAPDLREVEQFLSHEALLLDEQRWREWADLFVENGEYWVPATPGQPDPKNHISLIYETDLLRAVRVKRFSHPNAFSLQPRPRSMHMVSNVLLDHYDEATRECVVKSKFIMLHYRREEQTVYGGRYTHRLRFVDDGWRIVQKKVDLLNCDAPLDNILIYL